jgi:hypothetical protein
VENLGRAMSDLHFFGERSAKHRAHAAMEELA